jgi:hypothetical protein
MTPVAADSRTLATAAAEALSAAEQVTPEAAAAAERLAMAEEELQAAEEGYDEALLHEAETGTPAPPEVIERFNLARRTLRGIGNLAGRLSNTVATHLDTAKAAQKAALLARRMERAHLAMQRLPQLAEAIMDNLNQQRDLHEAYDFEKSILEHQGPWEHMAAPILGECTKRLHNPEPRPTPENVGERLARELEL